MALRPPGDFAVYFARHGETIYNAQNFYQGSRHDSALTERGRNQARDVGLILRDFISLTDPPHFVSSPIGRARTTMEIVLGVLGLPSDGYTIDKRVVEIDLGEWSGRYVYAVETDDKVRWDARQHDKWNIPAPGGENYAMVAARATSWLTQLTHEAVLISHGAFGRILRGLYLDLSWRDMAAMDEPHGVVFRLFRGRIDRMDRPLRTVFDDPAQAP